MKQNLNPIDKSNMRQVILDGPSQFELGLSLASDIKVEGKFSSVMISGMGGSSLPANVLRTYVNDLAKGKTEHAKYFSIYQNRFYTLPPESYSNCLNIISSYSGNTEETIASLEEALLNDLPCVAISSGGKIEKICKKKNVPFVKIPAGIEPRMATGYFFGAMFKILANVGLVNDMTENIVSMSNALAKNSFNLEKKAMGIAEKIKGNIPVVYANTKYKSLAMIWKIKLNENGKVPAFWNYFPEFNHNEMNGFANTKGGFFAIMLRDKDDHLQNLKRYNAAQKILETKGISSEIIDLEGFSVIEKIFTSLHLGDWVSYYLALANNQDPTPVDMVEEFKKLL
ncbi:MAG TPA: bifunctional phosphoglucose/phosphomannose isomerase [Candidatus Moranbacteria bacterium]|nr:bifunctional phosphoglucose/phosphomannose isomerase [Candidatus Moranbacteria bacterium]HBT46102.1 bifunctional phosphoglucose/phosphomannose isomerase [Candidatus Moranbacteria bacterium]